MDELVHHCLRELAFDGDLGKFVHVNPEDGERAGSNLPRAWCRPIARFRLTNVWCPSGCHPSRLRDFVTSYNPDSYQQNVDDAYFAFVWSLVVRQPTVRVGTVPDDGDGARTEVYIAPQQSQKKKSKEKDQRGDVLSLTLLPDARSRTLEDLQLQYGEALRVAVDAETSFAAITSSQIRVRFQKNSH